MGRVKEQKKISGGAALFGVCGQGQRTKMRKNAQNENYGGSRGVGLSFGSVGGVKEHTFPKMYKKSQNVNSGGAPGVWGSLWGVGKIKGRKCEKCEFWRVPGCGALFGVCARSKNKNSQKIKINAKL